MCLLFSLTALHPKHLNAQIEKNNISSVHLLKQINGIYDLQNETFYSQFIDRNDIKIVHHFESKKCSNGFGIAEYYYINSENGFKSKKTYGLIDVTGKILIPCIYQKILKTGNKDLFVFNKSDSLGIYNITKGIIYQIPAKTGTHNNFFFAIDKNINYCLVKINDLYGVFSYYKEKLVVPSEYSKIDLYNNTAVCQILNKYVVYNCEEETKSDIFKEVYPLDNGKYFFIRLLNGKATVCTDAVSPFNSVFRKINKEKALEFYNKHVICENNGKIGLMDEYGNEAVPFIYDDIFFFDKQMLLVKRDNFWAISDYRNNVLSEFQFINIEQQNQINLNNFIQFSGIDTSGLLINRYLNYESTFDMSNKNLLAEIKKKLITLKNELYSRHLSKYDNSIFPRYALQNKDGFQIITILSSEKIKIDSLCWDSVFMIPGIHSYPFEIGVRKGNKFGYYDSKQNAKKYLKYDGIYFYYELFYHRSIMFSGTHNESSPFTVVKKGYVYDKSSYPKTNWLKRLTTPPNYSAKYQGKPKWRKYMNEKEFLEERSINSNK